MKTRIHALAGGIGFLTILTFWTSTVFSELFASHAAVATVKQMILYGMFILIPAMAIAGASGMSLGRNRTDAPALAKKKRMPLIAANGLIILVPAAFYLESKASAGMFDTWFYAVQALELLAGAANLAMMGLNIRDGLTMTGRIGGGNVTQKETPDGPVIEERDNGPLVVKGVSNITGTNGEPLPPKPAAALCRCGASKNKPFCDGSHSEIGFDSSAPAEPPQDKLHPYKGKEVTVHFSPLLCSHAGECGKRLKAVFDAKQRPWITPDNGRVEDIIAVVKACPSGALSCSTPGQTPQHAVADTPGIAIEKNGPYRVVGVPLSTARLANGASPDKYVLCRCGASKNKPYCDGAHLDIKWRD